ncbi:DUF2922 domain-containing protein [Heyndrickxia faecalis]|uniref:DUF2922 domain-containing protein n=1 Tax=Heyndrickxia faecalis TaxID=2824910 RepID=UPI003D225881
MKTLELQFLTQDNKTVRVAVDEPAEPIDTVKVKNAMAQMLSSGVLVSSSGTAVSSVKGARLIEQNVTEYTLA